MTPRLEFPGGARFAFSVIDDTDLATMDNVLPIYRLIEALGMRTTKTVWTLPCPEGSSDFSSSETMQDPHYQNFVLDLQRRGFEIAFHGATMETSSRARTIEALTHFQKIFGTPPRVHANHSLNRENLYWGLGRLDDPLLRFAYRLVLPQPEGYYTGHIPGSPHWWGDLAADRIQYVRNLAFNEINLLRINPSMPYHDPRRPHVRWWFSASDAYSIKEFIALMREENQERLEAEGGVCIVATHFGKGFCSDGAVHPEARRLLQRLAARPGWFPPVGTLLDFLRSSRRDDSLPRAEWRRMQWRWAFEVAAREAANRRRRPDPAPVAVTPASSPVPVGAPDSD
jgi:hypothetical protein